MSHLTVGPGHVAVVRHDGKTTAVLAAGRHQLPRPFWRREVTMVDIREQLTQVGGQEILTLDVPGLKVNVVIRWAVTDPVRWLEASSNPTDSLRLAVQLAVRDWAGARTLAEVIAQRSAVDATLRDAVQAQAADWGIGVTTVSIRDLILPGEIRKALAAVSIARLEGLAALERTRSETASLRALANVGKLLADHPDLARLRLAQTASEAGGKVIIQLPG